MTLQLDILDEQESLRKPFLLSAVFHIAVFGLLVLSTMSFNRNREIWGSSTVQGGGSVAINPVKNIPLPSRIGPINPVANPTESLVPQEPKPEPKKQVKTPQPDAVPIKSRFAERQPRPQAPQRYQPRPLAPNQVTSSEAPAAVSRMFQKPGSGEVGVGSNNALGSRFGAYADRIAQLVTDKWQTSGLAGLNSAPMVIVTFDILRDGSVRNVQIAQRSGNSTLDYSAQRAVMDAAPFPPLPAGFDRNEANVELRFQLQR
jgi:protein TonB